VRRQLRAAAGSERAGADQSRLRAADNSGLAAAPAYGKLPNRQKELLGALLDQPALLGTAFAGRLEGLLSPELCDVFRAAAGAVQESGALDLSALFSALGDNQALPWLKERLTVQTYQNREDAEQLLANGVPLLEEAEAQRKRRLLSKEIIEARRNGDDERAVRLTKQRDELPRSASGLLRRER
jgi:hypothetical protein